MTRWTHLHNLALSAALWIAPFGILRLFGWL